MIYVAAEKNKDIFEKIGSIADTVNNQINTTKQ